MKSNLDYVQTYHKMAFRYSYLGTMVLLQLITTLIVTFQQWYLYVFVI